ncbi:lysozyme inhibitor LprI family protein [Psychrobacter sp.]|uniref:lysozyme inhibitor LprI family protein n=1 Tax=Psychrobacter sp. TaxID=56811 RepID=UPI0025E1C4F3|nr:lysozyme inhibitor LprI family protein [Psychrobacter sp.]
MKILFSLLPSGFIAIALFSSIAAQANYDCEMDMEKAYTCADNAVVTEKKRLNKTYMKIYQTLNTSQKQKLDTEQIAWIKRRDAKCLTPNDSQPINNMKVWQEISDLVCIANETQSRTSYFQKRFSKKR